MFQLQLRAYLDIFILAMGLLKVYDRVAYVLLRVSTHQKDHLNQNVNLIFY